MHCFHLFKRVDSSKTVDIILIWYHDSIPLKFVYNLLIKGVMFYDLQNLLNEDPKKILFNTERSFGTLCKQICSFLHNLSVQCILPIILKK